MVVWALLSISQTVKAVEFCIMGTFDGGDRPTWTKLDGKSMDRVGNNLYSQTYQCTKAGEYRFRFIGVGWRGEMCPDQSSYDLTQASPNCKVFYNDQDGKKDNYFYVNMESGKTYTFTFDDTSEANRTVACKVSGSEVVTKVIKLLDGSSELTGSNGKYTLDLSGETSSDAKITLTIDGAKYGLATAQTISAAGTANVDFVANATAALTLKAGLIYSLSVTEDGKMTVVAEEQVDPYTLYGAGFYLVGDFMSQYNDKTVNPGGDTPGEINYDRLYFKFDEQKDGSYKIDIPACLTAKMQILGVSVDGVPRVYGPSGIVELYGSKNTGTAKPETNGSLGGKADDLLEVVNNLSVDNNYWKLSTRNDEGIDDDGLYEISFKYDSDKKTPTVWTIKHDALTRVAYLLSDAEGATAQPVYVTRKTIGSELRDDNLYSNECKAALHFNGKNGYYVLSYIVSDMNGNEQKTQALKANDGIHATKSVNDNSGTHDKLFFLGNGGYDWSTFNNHNKVRANLKPFKMNLRGY